MKVRDVAEQFDLEVKTGTDHLDVEVTGGYCGDLMSTVMANANEGNVWVTWHTHQNIVAVALVVKLAAIIIVAGRQPEEETVKSAQREGLPILVTELPAFEIIGRLHGAGIKGVQ